MGHLPQMWWMMIHGPPNTLDHSKKVAISCHSHGVSMETNVFGMLMFHSYVKWQSRVNAQQSAVPNLSNFMEIQIPCLGNPDDFLLVLISRYFKLHFLDSPDCTSWLATSVFISYLCWIKSIWVLAHSPLLINSQFCWNRWLAKLNFFRCSLWYWKK